MELLTELSRVSFKISSGLFELDFFLGFANSRVLASFVVFDSILRLGARFTKQPHHRVYAAIQLRAISTAAQD